MTLSNKKFTDKDIDRYIRSFLGSLKIQVKGQWYDIKPSEDCDKLLRSLMCRHGIELELSIQGDLVSLKVDPQHYIDKDPKFQLESVLDTRNNDD